VPAYGPQNDVTLKMPAFEWVHVQLHQQKGMISLSPPTICNSAKNNDRYLTVLRYAGELQYDKYIPKIEQALMEVIMKYMMHNPKYLKINNLPVITYICINSGIFNVARHLILPNPFISFDEMVQGLTTMIMSYINTEMARSEDQS
ncbi:hypothetical protein ABR156_017620, partial [Acinetobacter baumannii]